MPTKITGRLSLWLALVGVALVAACSGGGGNSSPAPGPTSPLGGLGATYALNQRVNFTVIVPAPTVLTAVAAHRRRKLSIAATTNPYVSPNTGSITLQIVTVNGNSPRTLPALLSYNVACPGKTGCTVPIQSVPAATGVDRFAVQTFSGPGATGNLISSGVIDVTAPSAQATSFGGTALSIGGFVQSIQLALNVPGGSFTWHAPASATLDVNAIDPAGAIIIGSDQLANAIVLSLPASDVGAFALTGAQQVSLLQPAQSVALAYTGAILPAGTVSASTTDENGQPVATSIPIPITAPPTPTLPPVPPSKLPLSLYVYDGTGDRILEYSGINGVESGTPLSTTPRRVFEVAAPPTLIASATCAAQGSPFISDLAVSSTGTIYAPTYCFDTATGTLAYTFTYAASTQEVVPPGASPTPPPPTSTFSTNVLQSSPIAGIRLDEAHTAVFEASLNNNTETFGFITGLPISGVGAPTTNFGSTCLQDIALTTLCTVDPGYSYTNPTTNFAVDGASHVLIPASYQATNAYMGLPILPPGDLSENYAGEVAIPLYPAGLMNPIATPLSVLAGFGTELGFNGNNGPAIAIEGSTLYALIGGSTVVDPRVTPSPGSIPPGVNTGLSGCPPPAPNATPDTATNTCVDQAAHAYLAAYPNATQTLSQPGNAGTDVTIAPSAMIGGDVIGGFGSNIFTGDGFTVKDGFAYVVNPNTTPTEIDIYNFNNVIGYHTDLPPVSKLVLDPSIGVGAIAIGPTGTGVGGQAILRRPARVHHDLKAWRQRQRQLLQQHRQQRRQP